MAVRGFKCFAAVLMISVSITVFIASQEKGPPTLQWQAFVEKLKSIQKMDFFGDESWQTDEDELESTAVYSTEQTSTPLPETPIPIIFKHSFKRLPQWNFDDVYRQDAPPRPTTCKQSLRNSEDETFQGAFIPNIRLFLHKDNLNMREWNRLSHFNNPFGFMQMKYADIMAAIRLIPKPKEPMLLPKAGGDGCVHCAVVGTAGILNGSKMGAEIDAHDYVFRVNGAVIDGYEEDVGRRTSVYVHTAHSITASLIFFRKFGYRSAPHDEGIKYVLIPEGLRDYQWLQAVLTGERVSSGQYRNRNARSYYSGQYNETRFYVLHQDFMRYVRNRFLRSKNLDKRYWAILRPTNGAFAVFLALQTCDTVSAYGFMTEDYKKYSNYYFQSLFKTRVAFFANHDYLMEKNLWKRFHESNIIKLYQKHESQETEKSKTL